MKQNCQELIIIESDDEYTGIHCTELDFFEIVQDEMLTSLGKKKKKKKALGEYGQEIEKGEQK